MADAEALLRIPICGFIVTLGDLPIGNSLIPDSRCPLSKTQKSQLRLPRRSAVSTVASLDAHLRYVVLELLSPPLISLACDRLTTVIQ